MRLRLSNVFGKAPVTVGSVHLALGGTDRAVTFQGQAGVTLPPGEERLSDDVALTIPNLSELAISLYFPGDALLETQHSIGLGKTLVSVPGDFTGVERFDVATTAGARPLVTDLEVAGGPGARALVVLGDSLTDGVGSTPGANRRWPDALAERLLSAPGVPPTAVINEGIAGNRVLHEFLGPSALERLARDVLSKAGARYVMVLEGLNDFGIPGAFDLAAEEVSAEAVIAGHAEIVRRVHALGLKAYAGTLMPFEGAARKGYFTASGEAKRQAVNQWLRTSKAYDAVIDFDALLRDPAQPTHLLKAFDSGDHLHPNDAGYKAMAEAVDLALFR